MILLRTPSEVSDLVDKQRQSGRQIGFVPTMGALHNGHISLVKESVNQNDFTIVSVFVNPTQFNNADDLINYPRTEEADIALLESSGCDAVFFPAARDIYPAGEKSENFEFHGLENRMEGKFRPGHFDGVATVVKRFLEIIRPHRAYFGEKDFQQLRIIQELVKDLELEVEIVPVPIIREADGLAMSSRNTRLTQAMREESVKILKILQEAGVFMKNHTIEETKKFVEERFGNTELKLEYFEIADEETLQPVSDKESSGKLRGFVAAFAGEIRLIDNISLN